MSPDQCSELGNDVAEANISLSNAAQCVELLTRLNSMRSWVESRVLAVTQRLNELAIETPGIFPEQMVADATRVTLYQAIQPFRRAEAVELLPEFGSALTTGTVNVDHLDVVEAGVVAA